LEVIEIGCPAVHDTLVEHEITLPTDHIDPQRDFGGQRFVRHSAGGSARLPYLQDGLVARDTGIGNATDGLAGAVVVEAAGPSTGPQSQRLTHDGEFAFVVVLAGSAIVTIDATTSPVGARDAVALPPGSTWAWSGWTDDFEFLEVSLPADGIRTVWAG
jgi:quercetin dioxygenase-like cupin family protein